MAVKLSQEEQVKLTHSPWSWERGDGLSFSETKAREPEIKEFESYFKIITSNMLVSNLPKIVYMSTIDSDILPLNVGDKTYFLRENLRPIYDAIIESKYLLNLKEDWDDDGAIAIDKIVYYRAIETLIDYSMNVFNEHNIVIKSPHISAASDGSIDLDWSTPNASLLITILNTKDFNLHYYGDDGNNNTVIKGTINNSTVNDDLSFWMRKL